MNELVERGMKIGDAVEIWINNKKQRDGVIKRFSHIEGLVVVNIAKGGWMFVHEADLREKSNE